MDYFFAGLYEILLFATVAWSERHPASDAKNAKNNALRSVQKHQLAVVVPLAILPAFVILKRETARLAERMDALSTDVRSEMLTSRAGSVMAAIDEKNPGATERAKRLYAQMLEELEDISEGREVIRNEADYFAVMRELLGNVPDGAKVWDVVMPLNVDRVREGGPEPLRRYLDQLRGLVATGAVEYHLVLMPQQEGDQRFEAHVKELVSKGVNVYVLKRGVLNDSLIRNFAYFPELGVVCEAERVWSDARIKSGLRINNKSEVAEWRRTLDNIVSYAEVVPAD